MRPSIEDPRTQIFSHLLACMPTRTKKRLSARSPSAPSAVEMASMKMPLTLYLPIAAWPMEVRNYRNCHLCRYRPHKKLSRRCAAWVQTRRSTAVFSIDIRPLQCSLVPTRTEAPSTRRSQRSWRRRKKNLRAKTWWWSHRWKVRRAGSISKGTSWRRLETRSIACYLAWKEL